METLWYLSGLIAGLAVIILTIIEEIRKRR